MWRKIFKPLPDGDYELVPKGTYRKTDVKFLLANSEGLDKKAVKALDKNGIGNLKELYGLTEEEIRQKAGLIKTTQTFEALLKLLKRYKIYYIKIISKKRKYFYFLIHLQNYQNNLE